MSAVLNFFFFSPWAIVPTEAYAHSTRWCAWSHSHNFWWLPWSAGGKTNSFSSMSDVNVGLRYAERIQMCHKPTKKMQGGQKNITLSSTLQPSSVTDIFLTSSMLWRSALYGDMQCVHVPAPVDRLHCLPTAPWTEYWILNMTRSVTPDPLKLPEAATLAPMHWNKGTLLKALLCHRQSPAQKCQQWHRIK